MSVIPVLRRRDPAATSIHVRLHFEASDADLAQALELNPFVTEVEVNLHMMVVRPHWPRLLRVIATRANLQSVTVNDGGTNVPIALIAAFLEAIQQNARVSFVRLWFLHRLPANLSTFIDNAASIASLTLCFLDLEPVQSAQKTRDLAAALQRNTNIRTLKLAGRDTTCFRAVLHALRFNTCLTTLILAELIGNSSDEVSSAIRLLLESTATIRRFDFRRTGGFRGALLRPVAQGIISNATVSELKIVSRFGADEESVALIRDILRNKRNLTSLSLTIYRCPDVLAVGVLDNVIPTLLRADSPLRCFEFELGNHFDFEPLFRAVEASKLERFLIGNMRTRQQLQLLTSSIPKLKARELEVWLDIDDDDEDNVKQELLQAAKNNYSLRSFEVGWFRIGRDPREVFNERQMERLKRYAERNESLHRWVSNPATVPRRELWPDALKVAEQAGPDALFGGLRAVLGSDYYVDSLRGRKRKRPRYYAPS